MEAVSSANIRTPEGVVEVMPVTTDSQTHAVTADSVDAHTTSVDAQGPAPSGTSHSHSSETAGTNSSTHQQETIAMHSGDVALPLSGHESNRPDSAVELGGALGTDAAGRGEAHTSVEAGKPNGHLSQSSAPSTEGMQLSVDDVAGAVPPNSASAPDPEGTVTEPEQSIEIRPADDAGTRVGERGPAVGAATATVCAVDDYVPTVAGSSGAAMLVATMNPETSEDTGSADAGDTRDNHANHPASTEVLDAGRFDALVELPSSEETGAEPAASLTADGKPSDTISADNQMKLADEREGYQATEHVIQIDAAPKTSELQAPAAHISQVQTDQIVEVQDGSFETAPQAQNGLESKPDSHTVQQDDQTGLPGTVLMVSNVVPDDEDSSLPGPAPQPSAASRLLKNLGTLRKMSLTNSKKELFSGSFISSLLHRRKEPSRDEPSEMTPYSELKIAVLTIYQALQAESNRKKRESFTTLFQSIGGGISKGKGKKQTINVSGDLGEVLIRLGIAVEAKHLQGIIHKVCRKRGREPDSWYGAGVSLKTPVYNDLDVDEFADVMAMLTETTGHSKQNKLLEAHTIFSAFDKNRDKVIDADEFRQMVANHGLQLSDEHCEELLEQVAGPSKAIDFPTFLEFLGLTTDKDYNYNEKEALRQKLQETLNTFHAFDVDAGGTIDISELASILRAMGQKISPEELESMVDVADENGTGEIDFENFCRHVLQMSDREFMAMLEAHLEKPDMGVQTIGSKKRKPIEELAPRAWRRTLQASQDKGEDRRSFTEHSKATFSGEHVWQDYGQHAYLQVQHPLVAKIIAEGESEGCKVPLVAKKMLGRPMAITACKQHGTVTCAAFSPDGRSLALTCSDGTLRVTDLTRPKPKQVSCVGAHDHSALSLAWTMDGKGIITGGADRIVARWSAEDADLAVVASRVHHSAYVRCVCVSYNDEWVASCSSDMTVVLMSAKNLKAIVDRPLMGHTSWVRWCRFTHDNKRLITGSDDQTVMVWEVPAGHALQTLRAHLHTVACGAAIPSNKLFTAGFDENVLLWTQDTGLLGYLKVFVVEAFHLKRGDTLTTNMSNYRFVTIELGKGQREQTNTKKGSSPHWFEEFNMSVWNLDENVLVQVWDWDKDANHRMLGELMVPLEDLVYAEEGVTDREFDLTDEEGNHSQASISLRFTFREVECIGEVTVSIEKARNLPRMDTFGLSDPFCAVSVGKSERHKTKVIRRSLNPVWNEEFVYNVEEGAREVKMVLYDWSVTKEEDFIGQVLIPISSLQSNPFRDEWIKLKSIDGQNELKGELKVKIKFLSEAERDKGVVRFRRNPHTWPAAAKEDCQYYSPVGQLQFYGRTLMRGRCKHCNKHRFQHTGNLRCDLGIGNYVHCIDVSSCGTFVAWGTGDGRIRIAVISTGEQISSWTAHAGAVHGIAFASEDQRLCSWGCDYRTAEMADFFHGSFFPRNEAKLRKGRDFAVEVWYVGSMIKAVFSIKKRRTPQSPVAGDQSEATTSDDGSEEKEDEEEKDEDDDDDDDEEEGKGDNAGSPKPASGDNDDQKERKAARSGKEGGRLGGRRILPGAKVGYTPVYYDPPLLSDGTAVRSCLKGRGRKEVLSVPGLCWNEADPEKFFYPPENPDAGEAAEPEDDDEEDTAEARRREKALERKRERKRERIAAAKEQASAAASEIDRSGSLE